jgi:uncharacterized membrane protein
MSTLTLANMSPAIAIHLSTALLAVALGPVAIWARRWGAPWPKLHRAAGYAWVTCMVIAAVSALFIRGSGLPNIAGFSPIHLLVPFTLGSLVIAFRALARGDIRTHQHTLVRTYLGACIVAGAFTLMPGRVLGRLLWG